MTLILGIGAAAVAALAMWRTLRNQGEQFANFHLNEARRAAGIVNAAAYCVSVLLDAITLRRSAQYNPAVVVGGGGGTTVTVPARIGGRREDEED